MKHQLFALALGAAVSMAIPVFAQDMAVRPAKVVTVGELGLDISRNYPAIVLPSREVELSFRVPGQVIDLPIRAATEVAKGDVIARLDPRDFQSQVAQLQSAKDQAEAQLTALRSGARAEEIGALEAAVASARAQLEQAQDSLNRVQQLVERGVAASAQLESAQASFRVAQANVTAQQEQLEIGRAGGRPEEIAASEAALRGLEAQLKVARDNLDDATLTAPFDGIIARRDIEAFSNIQAGQSVALLQGLSVVHLAFDIPGPDVTQLSVNGPEAITNTATFAALPGQVFETEIVEFSVQADQATQTYRGRVSVAVPEGAVILPGMIAEITTSTPIAGSRIEVPLSAVSALPDGAPFVWLVSETRRVTAHPVVLGEAAATGITVLQGLSTGDMVVSAGVSQLVEGQEIRPISKVGE
ncbi:MAG: efflux RND transporter periplasmic adaptor subunit [Pelagimonas sp.]|jgi:multidrug efflux pump subunit AcrA (membrane-fusion protein)|nr:efflux RND transporter periplasmic adaptor subunit [Pelagimonas sp.]